MTRICSHCGSDDKHNNDIEHYRDSSERRAMVAHGYCWSCAFWCVKRDIYDNRNVVVEMKAGVRDLYRIGPETNDERVFRGFGGALFRIRMLADDTVVESRNLWHNGEIPETWRRHFPVTAEFLYP